MLRKILIVLAVVAALGVGAYFIFGNGTTTKAQDGKAASNAPATVSAAGAQSANGEFWVKRCNEEGDKYCEIFQRLTIKENNQRLIEFAVGYPKDMNGTAQAAIVLPLGVIVTDGIALKIDDGTPAKASFRLCTGDGCFIVMNLPDAFLASMKKGKMITVSFLDSSGKQVNVEMSLEGFDKKVGEIAR